MRYLLVVFFFVMYAGDNLGLNISLAPGISIKNLMLYVMLTWVAIDSAVSRNRSLDTTAVSVPFGLLLVYALATWIVAAFIIEYQNYGVRSTFIRFKSSLVDQFITFVVYSYGVVRTKDAFWVLRSIVWIAALGNVVTLIDSFNVPDLGLVEARLRDERFLGFIGQANEYGSMLVLFLPVTIVLLLEQKRRSLRTLSAIGVFSTALALVLTGSRGAYVGLVLGAILASFYLRRYIEYEKVIRAGAIAFFTIVAISIVTVLVGYGDVIFERFDRFEGSSHVATSGRSTIWITAIREMMEYPITFVTGFGFASYEEIGRFYAATHNMYLNYLYNLGIIGLCLFVLVFWGTLQSIRSGVTVDDRSVRRYSVAVCFGLFGFLSSLLFTEYFGSGYLLWAYLGAVFRLAKNSLGERPSAAAPLRAI